MKILFDFSLDVSDLETFANVVHLDWLTSEDEEKRKRLNKLHVYLLQNLNLLKLYKLESVNIGLDRNELELLVNSVLSFNPNDMSQDEILEIRCNCLEILVSTYFFFD